jgi:hypothetical protein
MQTNRIEEKAAGFLRLSEESGKKHGRAATLARL